MTHFNMNHKTKMYYENLLFSKKNIAGQFQ